MFGSIEDAIVVVKVFEDATCKKDLHMYFYV